MKIAEQINILMRVILKSIKLRSKYLLFYNKRVNGLF